MPQQMTRVGGIALRVEIRSYGELRCFAALSMTRVWGVAPRKILGHGADGKAAAGLPHSILKHQESVAPVQAEGPRKADATIELTSGVKTPDFASLFWHG